MDKHTGLDDYEVWTILKEVEDMEDEHLIDEVLCLEYTKFDNISNVVEAFMKKGELDQKQRDGLIGFYVLQWYQYDLEE